MQVEEGAKALKTFFDGVLKDQNHPQEWYRSLMCLLPKTCSPLVPKELRPVCLTSHLSKTFSRLIMQRIMRKIVPDSPFQCCAPHRQTTDYIWSAQRVMQIAYEWDVPVCAIKVDLEKAFDRLDRRALGALLVEELGTEFPTETKNILAMLKQGFANIPTVWGDGNTTMHIGVRQGGVESASLFGWVITKVLNELQAKWAPTGWIPDGQAEAQAFMDDIIAWDSTTQRLQSKITEMQALLSKFGLRINIQKSALLCYGKVGDYRITVGGVKLDGIDLKRETWTVMGVPVFPGVTEAAHMGALIGKARAKFFAIQDILLSEAPLPRKLWLLDRVVWTAISWSVGAIYPTQSAVAMLKAFQTQCICTMAKFKKRTDEVFYAFRMRTTRMARLIVFNSGKERWGTRFIRMNWAYTGHRARSWYSSSPSIAGILTGTRPYVWWKSEQLSSIGQKHGRRHFPKLSNEGRDLTRTVFGTGAGMDLDWRTAALDKSRWKDLEAKWVQLHDIPWGSGRQLSLC